MKLAVILGMFQMVLGLCLKGFNFYYFKEKIKILTVFLPQLVFFMSIFGYMIFLIVVKWCLQTEGSPGIVKTLIDMVMKKGLAVKMLYSE
jgi:V-type H+-transporting ATPase subunit a